MSRHRAGWQGRSARRGRVAVVFASTALVVLSSLSVTHSALATAEAPLGMGTVSPTSGALDTDLQLNVSRGCPSPSTGFDVRFSGGVIDGWLLVSDYTPLSTLLAAPDQTDSMTVALPINLDTIRAFAGIDALTPGTYTFVLRCRTEKSEGSYGDFAGAIVVTTDGTASGWTRVAWPTKATLTSVTGPTNISYAQNATFHVDVKTYRDVPKGTVQLFDNGRPMSASRPVVSGAADITIDALGIGDHSITARFSPSMSDTLASSSDSLAVTVVGVATELTVSARKVGGSVVLSATVRPSVDGIVTFSGPFPGGSHLVRSTGGSASYTVAATGSGEYAARFTPSDKGFAPAVAYGVGVDRGHVTSIGGSGGATGPVRSPNTDSGGSTNRPGAGANHDPTMVPPGAVGPGVPGSTPAPPTTPTGPSGQTPSPATTGPALGSKSAGGGVVIDAVDSGPTNNPSTDGALSISVQGVVASTGGGSASTSYGIDVPIGAAAATDNVVILKGDLDASAQYITMSGSIIPVVVRDTRADYPGYEVTGTMSDLSDGSGNSVSAGAIGWTPQFISSTAFPAAHAAIDAGLVDGPTVDPGDLRAPAGGQPAGLTVERQLFFSPRGIWAGSVTYGAILVMHAPTATPPGDYHALLTLTVTGAVL